MFFTNFARVTARGRILWFCWCRHSHSLHGWRILCVQSARITSSQVTYISKRWVNRSSNSTLFYTHRLNNLARALCRLLSLKLIGIFVAIKWRRPKHTRHNSSEALKHLLIPPPLFGHYCRIPNLNCQPCARCAAPSQLPWLQGRRNNLAPVIKVKVI